jgi:GTP cyclohydrolase I
MIKEESYREKFIRLEPWIDAIFKVIKKEIKNEHLRNTPQLLKKYFYKKFFNKLTNEEIKQAYLKEILEGNDEVSEWVISRWMYKNINIYQFFSMHLTRINPEFDKIETIPEAVALPLMQSAALQFGPVSVYIFSVFNEVAFSAPIFEALRAEALKPS